MNFARTVLTATALVAITSPAYAAVTIQTTFAPGQSTTSAPVFQPFTTGVPNGTPFSPAITPIISQLNSGSPVQSSTGTVNYYQGDVGGEAVGPDVMPGTGSFISILNGTYSVAFTGIQVFSFVYGGLDSYNSVTLNFRDAITFVASSLTLSGEQICGGAANIGCALGSTGRVTYDFGGTGILDNVTFASAEPAFEIDELTAAVPEPATWALMILGFGIVGSQLRRRKANVKVKFATA